MAMIFRKIDCWHSIMCKSSMVNMISVVKGILVGESFVRRSFQICAFVVLPTNTVNDFSQLCAVKTLDSSFYCLEVFFRLLISSSICTLISAGS